MFYSIVLLYERWYNERYVTVGSETIAHLRENKRITIMFCAFDGPPRIVRLFGTGVVEKSFSVYVY